MKNLLPAIAVLIISSLLFLTGLGANSLADWDEAWYADASRFMFRNDHFLTPIWNGQYFFDKPPLQYWLTQPFLYLFGETELGYRLPSALAAIALTLITYLWGKQQGENFALKKPSKLANLRVRLLPSEATPSASEGLARALARVTANEQISANEMASAGWLSGLTAAIILLTFPHFLDRGRSGNFDALFIFFTTFSMFLMVKNRPALGGIFLGLSWLTKGVFSGLFPIVVFSFLTTKNSFQNSITDYGWRGWGTPVERPQLSTYERGRRTGVKPATGPEPKKSSFETILTYIFFAVLIYAPWHLLEYTRFDHLIQQSYFAAFDQGEFGGWSWMDIAWRFDLRYLVFLWTFLRWWFPILLIALIWKFHQLIRTPHPRLTTHNSQPLITFIVIFLALSASKSKNDWYITPAYPFIALMIADALGSLRKIIWKFTKLPTSERRFVNFQVIIFITFITLISLSNLYLYRRQAFPLDLWLPEKELGLTVKNLTNSDDLVVTAEYEFPTLHYYSERQVRTAARQPDYEGKYWWIWDNTDIATALRRGQNIVTIHRPDTEWSIDVPGYHREKLTEANNRIISRLIPN